MRRTRTESDKKNNHTLAQLIQYRSKSKDIVSRLKETYQNRIHQPILIKPTIVSIKINSRSPSPHNTQHHLKIKIPIKSRTPNNKSPFSRTEHVPIKSPGQVISPQILSARPAAPKLQQLKRKPTDLKLNYKPSGTQKYFRKQRQRPNQIQNASLTQTLRMVHEHRQKPAKTEFKSIKTIGKTQSGQIFKAVSNIIGIIAAIKTFRKNQSNLEFLIDQMKIQLYCQHPNILPAYGYHIGREEVFLVMEVGECNLYDQIVKYAPYEEQMAANYISQIAAGVAYLHEQGIMHRDIKPQNIIMVKGCLKIADFGWSIRANKPRKTLCGTLDYISPEVCHRQYYNNKIDVWSIGVLMYELLTGQPPFPDQSQQHNNFSQIAIPKKLSVLGKDLLEQMLEINPIERISARQILEHQWIRKHTNKRQYEQNIKFKQLAQEFHRIFQ